jgi:hypothetical protein
LGWRYCRGTGLAVVLAASLAAAACSSAPAGSKTAAQLIPEIVAAAESATSAHITGSGTEGAQTIDLDVSFSGSSAAGTVGSNGTSFYFLSLNGKTYIKLDAAFLKVANAPASACAKVCGKYVEIPAAEASQVTGALSLHKLLTQAFDNNNTKEAEASGCVFSPATVNGQHVLQCSQGGYTLDVASHGKPYPVYLTGPHGEQLSFSNWNSVTLPPAPPVSQVITVPGLG